MILMFFCGARIVLIKSLKILCLLFLRVTVASLCFTWTRHNQTYYCIFEFIEVSTIIGTCPTQLERYRMLQDANKQTVNSQ